MSSPPSLVWFVLLDSATGEPYKNTSASSILLSSLAVPVVDQFRKAVKAEYDNPNYLKDIPSGALLVYKNKAEFGKRNIQVAAERGKPLDPTEFLGALGSKEDMLVVVVDVTPGPLPEFTFGLYPENLPTFDRLTALVNSEKFVTLKKEAFEGSGIGRIVRVIADVYQTTDMVMYLRDRCREQVRFIKQHIEIGGGVGLIIGQPGTGKSVTAYMTALVLAAMPSGQGPIVLWVHIDKSIPEITQYKCVLMHNGRRSFASFSSEDVLKQFMIGDWGIVDSVSKRVLFIDGYVQDSRFGHLSGNSFIWINQNKRKYRVIFLSSMGSSCIIPNEARITLEIEKFIQYSWTYEEYVAAMKGNDFKQNVSPELVPPEGPENQKADSNEYMKIKYYYAGGSARFMFQLRTRAVVGFLNDLLDQNDDLGQLTNALRGNCSPSLRHTLLSVFGREQRQLVSDYVKHSIAMKTKLGPLLDFAREFKSNASMCGWLFEEFFFNKLWTSGSLQLRNAEGNFVMLSSGTRMWYIFNPDHPVASDCPINEWLRPMRYNQGGYDGVRITTRGTIEDNGIRKTAVDVTFIQCTISASHDAKLNYCFDLLTKLDDVLGLKTVGVQYQFIVPQGILGQFRIGTVLGLPKDYDWTDRSLVVHGIEGWISDK